MSILVDIIILALIALSIFIGYKRGLIKCAINVLSFFIAIIVVILLTTPISNLIINTTEIDDNIKNSLTDNIKIGNVSKEDLVLTEENSNVPEVVRKYINDLMADAKDDEPNVVVDTLAQNLTVMIINVGVAVVLFIGTKIILIFVKVLADIIGKIPLIKQFNEVGGIIYGIFSGIVKVYLILAVISIIVPIITDSTLIDAINSSILGSFMYNNNILLKIIL